MVPVKSRPGHRSWQIAKALSGEASPRLLRLLPRERRILRLRASGHSLRDIGTTLSLSGERVRQIEWLARRKLDRIQR
ncbi:MAG: hypothetical protein KGK34_01090 [Chloroflexota bacterium]|nr:hypothetical protein [Chloroflexota bacterium]